MSSFGPYRNIEERERALTARPLTREEKLDKLVTEALDAAERLRELGSAYADGYARGVEVMASGIEAALLPEYDEAADEAAHEAELRRTR